jgi:serine/threonine protein kinase
MGEVYKARDPVLNRFVALKTLVVRASPGDESLDRFKREAQAAAQAHRREIEGTQPAPETAGTDAN